ncbi:MAG: hypothetical protein KY467_09375 [Gemmatimonadetes bacterium]|nr:hypothetical protein [Gemmatimonadota bacterium]
MPVLRLSIPRTGSAARLRSTLFLLVLLAVGANGCQERSGEPRSGEPPAGTEGARASGASGAEIAVVRGLVPGDRACYVDLEDGQGQRSEQAASFEFCERSELVGQRVRLTRERTAIPAMSCQGDPECAQSDSVDLIVAAEKDQ